MMRARESSPSPCPTHSAPHSQGTLALGDDPFRGENTLVADASWDEILSDSPHSSPGELTPTGTIDSNPRGSAEHNAPRQVPPPPLQFTEGDRNRSGTPSDRSMAATPILPSTQPHSAPQSEREVVESNVITNSKGLRRTAAPNGGWPEIHLQSSPWDNVEDSQIEAWSEVTSRKIMGTHLQRKI